MIMIFIFFCSPPWSSFILPCPSSLSFLRLAPGMQHFSRFLHGFLPRPGRSTFSPAAFAPNTLQKHMPLLFLCTRGLLRMHSHSHAACIYAHFTPFCSASTVLHTHTRTHTSFYAHQLFDQPTFTQTTFCTNQLLQPSFYSTRTTCSTNQPLHQPALNNPCFGSAGQRPEGWGNAEDC